LFGKYLSVAYFIVNCLAVLIRINFVHSTVTTKNDPGIKIWWLCGLRFGQRGKYTEKEIRKLKIKKLDELQKKELERLAQKSNEAPMLSSSTSSAWNSVSLFKLRGKTSK